MADFGRDMRSSDSLRGSRIFVFLLVTWITIFTNFALNNVDRCRDVNFQSRILKIFTQGSFFQKTQKFLENVPILATSSRRNSATITDRRKRTDKLNLYGMSSFHYGNFSNFQDGGRRHLAFWKFPIFNGRSGQEGRTASSCQISSKPLKPRLRYGYYSILQDGGRRHLGFLKFQIFNGRNGQEGQAALLCQILSKSLETRLRYGYFPIFQHGGRCHFGFPKFQIFNGHNGQEGRNCISRPNFVKIS